jgi:hypothetical protein
MSAEFDKLLPALVQGGVEFILIGGLAGNVHGAARLTYDVDVVSMPAVRRTSSASPTP